MTFKIKLYTFLFFLLWLPNHGYSQNVIGLKKNINRKKIGKEIITTTKFDSTFRTYLGYTSKNKKVKYHVISEFLKTRASSTWHGHSTIYFFDSKSNPVAFVTLGLPENLPWKLQNNKLYFWNYKNKIKQLEKVIVPQKLEGFLCTKANGCDNYQSLK